MACNLSIKAKKHSIGRHASNTESGAVATAGCVRVEHTLFATVSELTIQLVDTHQSQLQAHRAAS